MVRILRKFATDRIAVVGAGPCGLSLMNFLKSQDSRHQVSIFEKRKREEIGDSHPAAHYINARSAEIFTCLPWLKEELGRQAEEISKYQKYVYCREIGGFRFQTTNQLDNSEIVSLRKVSQSEFWHMPQNRFNKVLLDGLVDDSKYPVDLRFGSKVVSFEQTAERVI